MSRYSFFLLVAVLIFSSCHEEVVNPNKELALSDFLSLTDKDYKLNSHKIRRKIQRLIKDDSISLAIDTHTRKYYSQSNPFVWISRSGLRRNADTLLDVLAGAGVTGINPKIFRLRQLKEDVEKVRQLDFPGAGEGINTVFARLEYNLTKAYFRYVAGQSFGFVNPDNIYNRIEKKDSDSVRVTYKQLCDLRPKRPDASFYSQAIDMAFSDSLSFFLASVSPQGTLYKQLVTLLNDGDNKFVSREKIICNIERCRWRLKNSLRFDEYKKYVIVNIPSFSLRAVEGNSALVMRTGCGSTDNKTPLLVSRITRMDVNPQWIIPKSIAKGIVGRHGYMHKMGMFVYERERGKMPPEAASYSKVLSGEQFIIQSGGKNNSLGRVIFRFNNNFSVYLHDTSSPWIFRQSQRDVSHGCVRVERPLDLAMFLAENEGDRIKEKLKYSMTVDFVNDKDSLVAKHIDKNLILNSVKVEPSVPVFITYYTVFYDRYGKLQSYPDVYGYDKILLDNLALFAR